MRRLIPLALLACVGCASAPEVRPVEAPTPAVSKPCLYAAEVVGELSAKIDGPALAVVHCEVLADEHSDKLYAVLRSADGLAAYLMLMMRIGGIWQPIHMEALFDLTPTPEPEGDHV